MSRPDVAGSKDEGIKLLVEVWAEKAVTFPFSSTLVSVEKADMYSRAAFGDENRLSGRWWSKLKMEYIN